MKGGEVTELIPKGLPKGREVLQEGIKIGKTIELGRSAFLKEKNVRCESDWKRIQAEKGNIQWGPLLGLSTIDEQVKGVKRLWDWSKSRGLEFDRCNHICSMLSGLPRELRTKAPRPTSFVMENPEDWVLIAQSAPVAPYFDDFHIGTPNSVYNVINAIRAGAASVGVVSQYVWDYPYFSNDVAQLIETVKAIGIVASKREDGITCESYLGDGLPSQFVDHASEIGYMRLEQYVVEELCGANHCAGLGGLISDVPSKLATWLALNDILKANLKIDHNVVSYFSGNSLEPTGDIDSISSNYALVVAEFIPFAVLERINKTGCAYQARPITEGIRVPIVDEIIDVFSVCAVALKKSREYEYGRMFDFSRVTGLRSILVKEGDQFFKNILEGLSERGVDTNDPLQILLAVKRLGARRLEEMFHPGEKDSNYPRGFIPCVPTDLIRMATKTKDEVNKRISALQLGDVLKGKKIVTGSTDTHEYGLWVLNNVLSDSGAQVIDGGVALDAEEILALALEASTHYIAVATHNGLCLDYGKRLIEVAKQRNQDVKIFMGGLLNGMVEGVTEPIDVSDRLVQLGIYPCKEVDDLFKEIAGKEQT